MRYISTRDNIAPLSAAEAINLGMVPAGGLFVPESIPHIAPWDSSQTTYHETARRILASLLTEFSDTELTTCIDKAYNHTTFDIASVVDLVPLGSSRFVMELWHGPTAAFKDVALQIMPSFMGLVKKKLEERSHTVILVATSGDTGKAALEGFRDREGISIVVFYPADGVSKVQELQMTTTGGANTHVVAVKGNFDDCQTGVKALFGDSALSKRIRAKGFAFSSANSINWGRLCPQIVYYYHAYQRLLAEGKVRSGDPVDFCVPTGNFGNILAGYYARRMGLPVRKFICASNRNRILTDFFAEGTYDRNREFHRTISPAMDILISSNLERFLFEVTGHDADRVRQWYGALAETGKFTIEPDIRDKINEIVDAVWVDESQVLTTIGTTFRQNGYVVDPHTAVGVAAAHAASDGDVPLVIDSTASPYKFSGSVLQGIEGTTPSDEFACVERLQELSGTEVHRAVKGLRERPVRHRRCIEPHQMRQTVEAILGIDEIP